MNKRDKWIKLSIRNFNESLKNEMENGTRNGKG